MANIRVTMPGKGAITLADKDHRVTGGEGSVYVKNGQAFKLYLDPVKARSHGIEDKIKLLASLKHPNIVAPTDVLLDDQHQVVGFYMPEVTGEALVRTFSSAWRTPAGFGREESVKLVEGMRETVSAAHTAGALMVDANEMNWLVKGTEPLAIDVDSWQIGRFKATALMPSIRDYHAQAFSEVTDWFAWGITSFQVFTGIHPYKGVHPDFAKGALEARMRANASVFDSRVRLNSAVRSFSEIPAPLAAWYEKVFQGGERSVPPSARASAVQPGATRKTQARTIQGGGLIKHDRLLGLPGAVRLVLPNGIAIHDLGFGLGAYDLVRKVALLNLSQASLVEALEGSTLFVRYAGGVLSLRSDGAQLEARHVAAEREPAPLVEPAPGVLALICKRLLMLGSRVFALTDADYGMVELDVRMLGTKPLVSVKQAWPVAPTSTQFFWGLGVMDRLGTPFLVVPEAGAALSLTRCEALKAYYLTAGSVTGVGALMLTGIRRDNGHAVRLHLVFDGKAYRITEETVVDAPDLNLATNEQGVTVGLFEDGELQVFRTAGGTVRVVADASTDSTMRLFALPSGIHYYRGEDVYKLTLG
jgi:hypothetical protein